MPAGYTLVSKIPQIIEKTQREVRSVNAASAKRIQQDAIARAPDIVQRNGRLEVKQHGDSFVVTATGWARSFGHLWEWGTVRMGARPYLTPAAEAERERHRKAIAELYK